MILKDHTSPRGKKLCCYFFLAILFLFAVSCAHTSNINPGKYTDWADILDELEIIQPLSLSKYSRILILPLDTSSTPLPDNDDNSYKPVTNILSRVDGIFMEGMKRKLEDLKNISIESSKSPLSPDSGVLLVRGKVTAMNPGSRALRYFVGFGVGSSIAGIQGEVVDAQSGNVFLKFKHARASSAGAFGGNYEKLMTNDTNNVAEDIGKMLLKFR